VSLPRKTSGIFLQGDHFSPGGERSSQESKRGGRGAPQLKGGPGFCPPPRPGFDLRPPAHWPLHCPPSGWPLGAPLMPCQGRALQGAGHQPLPRLRQAQSQGRRPWREHCHEHRQTAWAAQLQTLPQLSDDLQKTQHLRQACYQFRQKLYERNKRLNSSCVKSVILFIAFLTKILLKRVFSACTRHGDTGVEHSSLL